MSGAESSAVLVIVITRQYKINCKDPTGGSGLSSPTVLSRDNGAIGSLCR